MHSVGSRLVAELALDHGDPFGRSQARAAEAVAPADGHRRDIDGLRALAVLPVVLYHARVPGLPGGFVGVDIFFVISGFLIGGIVFRECRAGAFSLVRFYARRARRILPALIAVLGAVFLAAGLLLTPHEMRQFAKGAFGAITASSNVVFYLSSGYFAPAAATNPLLMTWSLGVEEQFYLVFPLLMLLLSARSDRTCLAALAVISAISFAGSLVLTATNPQAAFYLPLTRAWELGLGAMLAVWETLKAPAPRASPLREAKGLLGFVLVAAAITLYRPSIAFPGSFALAPAVGAALLISARSSCANRWLAAPPLVFIGLVSYSWYLWHWPMLSFLRIVLGVTPPLALGLTAAAMSFGAAVLSWRYVETPFRRRRTADPEVLGRYGVAASGFAAAAALAFVSGGWPERFSPAMRTMTAQAEAVSERCLVQYGARAPDVSPACLPPDRLGAVALLGDSHANALAPAVKAFAASRGAAFLQMTKAVCPALIGYTWTAPAHPGHAAECEAFQRAAFARVLADPRIRTVVLASFWPAYKVLETPGQDGAMRPATLPAALDATLTALRASGREVVLVQDVPVMDFDPYADATGGLVPARAALGRWLGKPDHASGQARVEWADAASAAVAAAAERRPGVRLVTPARALCQGEDCRFVGPTGLYYRDEQHLTPVGARAALAALVQSQR